MTVLCTKNRQYAALTPQKCRFNGFSMGILKKQLYMADDQYLDSLLPIVSLFFDCLRLWNAVAAVKTPPKRRFNGFFPRVYLKLSYFAENWYPYSLLPHALSLFKSCLILSRRCQRRTPPKRHFNGFFSMEIAKIYIVG